MENELSIKKYIMIFLVVLIILFIGITYAVLQRNLKIQGITTFATNSWHVYFDNVSVSSNSVTATKAPTIGTKGTKVEFTVTLNKPGDFYEFYVDVVNNGTIDAKVGTLTLSQLTDEQKQYLNYYVTYDDGVGISAGDALNADKTDRLKVVVQHKEDAVASNNQTITLSADLTYVQDEGDGVVRSKNSLYQLLKSGATNDNGVVNFGQTSIENNTNGKYLLHTTSKWLNPIYYYRGNVDNNVIFNNYCWKMIRTTDTGGVKLIYNGKPTDGKCENTGVNIFIEDDTSEPKKYTGKHRWAVNHYSIDDAFYRTSEMKIVLESWYGDHMTNVTSKLEDTPFHNETTYTTNNAGIVKGTFPAGYRIWKDNSNTPVDVLNSTIALGNTVYGNDDTYSVGTTNANNKLTYPVGLIESDEVILAGGRGYISSSDTGVNRRYYLHNGTDSNGGNSYWTFSSSGFDSNFVAIMIYVDSDGYIGAPCVSVADIGVRPVISLKAGSTYHLGEGMSGNAGSSTNPYIID